MSTKTTSEQRVELIRSLKKLECNKYCMNCGDRGPQSVCLPFNTFVCLLCHGIHAQYGHRCKGISTSTFDDAEVANLQSGGNGVAKNYWLYNYSPDSTDMHYTIPSANDPNISKSIRETKIRDFIKACYIDKKWLKRDEADTNNKKSKKKTNPQAENEKGSAHYTTKSKSKPKKIESESESSGSEEEKAIEKSSSKQKKQKSGNRGKSTTEDNNDSNDDANFHSKPTKPNKVKVQAISAPPDNQSSIASISFTSITGSATEKSKKLSVKPKSKQNNSSQESDDDSSDASNNSVPPIKNITEDFPNIGKLVVTNNKSKPDKITDHISSKQNSSAGEKKKKTKKGSVNVDHPAANTAPIDILNFSALENNTTTNNNDNWASFESDNNNNLATKAQSSSPANIVASSQHQNSFDNNWANFMDQPPINTNTAQSIHARQQKQEQLSTPKPAPAIIDPFEDLFNSNSGSSPTKNDTPPPAALPAFNSPIPASTSMPMTSSPVSANSLVSPINSALPQPSNPMLPTNPMLFNPLLMTPSAASPPHATAPANNIQLPTNLTPAQLQQYQIQMQQMYFQYYQQQLQLQQMQFMQQQQQQHQHLQSAGGQSTNKPPQSVAAPPSHQQNAKNAFADLNLF